MESQVSPSSIEQRAEALAAQKTEEVVVPVPEVKPEIKAEVKPEVKAEIKPEVKSTETPKIPNDPTELRKWNTKVSQDNAALRDEIKALKTAVDKLSKKPIDYKELAKNPEMIQKQIELERQEAIDEMQQALQEKTHLAIQNETIVERMKMEQDVDSFPEWKRLFPVIQSLSANADGRINFNQQPRIVLESLYDLALQLSPVQVPVTPQTPAPVVPVKSAEEIAAEIAAAEKRGYDKAQESLRAEQNGAGIGGAGKGGRRSSGVSKEALQDMPLKDLKALISKE